MSAEPMSGRFVPWERRRSTRRFAAPDAGVSIPFGGSRNSVVDIGERTLNRIFFTPADWAQRMAGRSSGTGAMSDVAISVLADPAHELTFDVVVRDARSESRHRVTMQADDAARWAKPGAEPRHCVEAAMQFLLDREPKESILGCSTCASFGVIFLSSTMHSPAISPALAARRARRIILAETAEEWIHECRPRPAGGDS